MKITFSYRNAVGTFMCLIALLGGSVALAEEPATAPAAPVPPATKTEAAPAPGPTYTGEALKIKEQMEGLFEASKKVNDAKGKKEARAKIENALDWDKIAQDCLGKSLWAKQAGGNREKFRALLKEVILKTAFSRMDKFWDNTTYTFEKIDVKGSSGQVKSNFKAKEENLALDYYLGKKGSRWVVNDISYEDLRYSENINQQITAFLKENNFAALLEKLRKRREELDKDVRT